MIIRKSLCLLLLLFISLGCASKKEMKDLVVFQGNKTLPRELLPEVKQALSYFPGLRNVSINFKYKKATDKSFMQAQPAWNGIFRTKASRSYNIYINSKFRADQQREFVGEVPSEVLVGWLGHELGHIVDYQDRSAAGMILFGIGYITSEERLMEAERVADVFAVERGMAKYILATKRFILGSDKLPDSYKDRITALYLSPKEILALLNAMEKELTTDQEEG